MDDQSKSRKQEIQHLLATGYYTLKFPPLLEDAFLEQYRSESRKIFTINSVYVVLIFIVMGGILFYRLPKEEWGFLLECYIALSVILTILITCFQIKWLEAYMDVIAGLATYFGIVVCTMSVLGAESVDMLLASQAGVSLSFIFVYALARQRCFNVGVACCLAGITHLLIAMFYQFPFDIFRFQAYFTGPNLLGLAICYMLEHRERTLFLQSQLIELDKIEIESLNADLEKLSQEDSLTGLANRRVFEEVLQKEWNRGQRYDHPLAIVFADVDYFKQFNDLYGHQKGDHCLQVVASVLRQECGRASDLAARYGGEEFILLYAETDQNALVKILERLVQAITDARIPHEHSAVAKHVTISFGAVSIMPSGLSSPSEAIRLADDALYQAKQAGRNGWKLSTLM